MKLIVGMSGEVGSVYGLRLLETLRRVGGVETHLITSRRECTSIGLESSRAMADVGTLVDVVHDPDDRDTPVLTGPRRADAMVVLPCSMSTLAAVRDGDDGTPMGRAAAAVLEHGRPLVLGVRESPLSPVHLENMLALARAGATIMPPTPRFSRGPQTFDGFIAHYVARVLDRIGVDVTGVPSP